MTVRPELGPEPGWREPSMAGRSFVSGEALGDRLRARYFARDEGGLVAKAWFALSGCDYFLFHGRWEHDEEQGAGSRYAGHGLACPAG